MPQVATRPTRQARSARQILDEIREPILTGLSRALRRGFASAIDALLEKLLAEKSWDVRQQIDDALDLLRNGREGIETKFDQACVEEWVSRTGAGRETGSKANEAESNTYGPRSANAAPAAAPSMLTLLDDKAIGDQLTVGRIATRSRRRLEEEQIDGLRARFGALLERDWFADNDFPIAPDVVLESLRKALAAFGPVKVVADLLDQFEPSISDDLATLYAEINALLVKRGVMPEIKYQISKGHEASAGADSQDDAQDDELAGQDDHDPGYGGGAGGSGHGQRSSGRGRAGPAGTGGRYSGGGARGDDNPGGGAGGGSRGGGNPGGGGGYVGRVQGAIGRAGAGTQGRSGGRPMRRQAMDAHDAGWSSDREDGDRDGGSGHYPADGSGLSFFGATDTPDEATAAGSANEGSGPQFAGSDGYPEAGDGRAAGAAPTGAPGSAAGTTTEGVDAQGVAGSGQALAGGATRSGAVQGDGESGRDRSAPSMLPGTVVNNLAEQVGRRIPAAQGSATRYLSDNVRFGTSHANLPPASDNLLTALSTLQVADPVEGLDAAAMVAAARATSAQAAREHGSPLERLIIETVGLVFEHVYEDPAIADTIKQQLLRLQVAAFKAALIDPSFFARPEHPMRRLIDRIAELGSDPDFETDPGSPMVVAIAEVVTWVVATFDRDLDVFETAITRVLAIVEAETGRRSERLAKIAVAAAKAETLERTRDEVRDELLAAVESSTPEFVTRFIADHWAEVVSRIRTGAEYAPFDEGRAGRTARTLLWSIAPKLPSQVRELASELPQLIADLSRGLSFVATSEAERELFFSELLAWHGAAIAEAKRMQQNPGVRTARVTAAIEAAKKAQDARRDGETSAGNTTRKADATMAEGTSATPAADATPGGETRTGALARDAEGRGAASRSTPADDPVAMLELVNGTEVELHSANGESKRLKLGWMSPARTVFIFSRYPKDHWTARRPVLNQLLEQGRLRVISRPPKTGQVIDSLKAR